MNLKGLVAVSGKPGLYKIIGQNKSGFVLEGLDDQKVKLVVNLTTAKLASLEDITIFGDDEDLKLIDILENMKGSASIPDPKADGTTLRKYFREIAPSHDEERVYSSDIKKVILWFNIIKDLPLFTEGAGSDADAESGVEVLSETTPAAEDVKPAKKANKSSKKAE